MKVYCIKGSYVSMKNSKRIVRFGNRIASIKKQKALDWEQLAAMQIRPAKEPYLGPVALIGHFYYDNVRADLDENLLKDFLQIRKPGKPCAKLVKDDNQIKRHDTIWMLDKQNPRVVFALIPLEDYERLRADAHAAIAAYK